MKDLAVIHKMFGDSKTDIVSEILTEVRRITQNNTDQIVELITSGFKSHDGDFMNFLSK